MVLIVFLAVHIGLLLLLLLFVVVIVVVYVVVVVLFAVSDHVLFSCGQ